MNETTQNTIPRPLDTPSITGEPRERLSLQETWAFLPSMVYLLINTNDLMEALDNIIDKVHAGRSEEIIDKIMPLFKLLDIVQDECAQLQRWNAIVRDGWVERRLEDIEPGLERMAGYLGKLAFLGEMKDMGGESPEDDDERGERHYDLALRQIGLFGTEFCYGL